METKKQTAVEWLQGEIEKFIDMGNTFTNEFEKAKAMEKEQIELAFRDGWFDGNNPLIFKIENERYYNEKYKDESKTNI
jgi:hypothetical protein